MPFSTDANWPQGLLDIFSVSRHRNEPFESRYYCPYDRLFNYAVVECPFALFLASQTAPDETSPCDTVEFLVFMIILNQNQQPVLVNSPIPRLYGLSLLGTSLCVYCGDKVIGEVTPDFIGRPNEHRVLPPDFLEGEWNLDILSPLGLAKMRGIAAYIKAEAANVLA